MASRYEALRGDRRFDVKIRSLSELGIDYRRNERVLVNGGLRGAPECTQGGALLSGSPQG
jgi:hypothetical protein